MSRIILASGSPRRRQLLEWAEIAFDVRVSDAAETWPEGLAVGDVPVHIARNKALAVKAVLAAEIPVTNEEHICNPVILAADTVVVLDDEIIGKPKDREDAIGILSRLAGRRHEVITGVVLQKGQQEIAFADRTAVWFHELDLREIEGYVDRYKPFDKAGAYAIQEWIGVVGIKGIEGDFYNVMGLPVSRVARALRTLSGPGSV